MYITYHEQILLNKKAKHLSHVFLNEEIQDFIEERKVKQTSYEVLDNGCFLFIYLINGDRIDVAL